MADRVTTEFWFAQALLPTGWAQDVAVSVEDGLIRTVTPGQPPRQGATIATLVLPGVANLHSHAFQRGMAGLTEARGPGADSFWTWRAAMYRFIDVMTPDDMEAIAALAYAEMLESGFTHVAEFHYLHHDAAGRHYGDIAELSGRIAAAAMTSGIGLTLLPVFYAHAGFGGLAPAAGQRRFITTLDAFADIAARCATLAASLPNGRAGIAPHSLRAVTPDELQALLAAHPHGPVHMHIAEQLKEVEDCLAWSGQRPVAWLYDHVTVDRRWCLIHATHMTADETAALAGSGAVAGLCPLTEANLGDGIFPAPDFLARGGTFGVGSDSNVRIAMPAELEILEYGQRLTRLARNVLSPGAGQSTGRALFDHAVRGGAQACAIAAGIAPGAAASFVSLQADHPALAQARDDQIIDACVFAAHRLVDGVWSHGRQMVADGQHVARDAIARRYRQAMARMAAAQ